MSSGVGGKETPPRAWGRLSACSQSLTVLRNTPTCVGKTFGMPQILQEYGKHPHVRGEDVSCRAPKAEPEETPPRAWGRRKRGSWRSRRMGNTPTCVGKTTAGINFPSHPRKHPHVRGEDIVLSKKCGHFAETPPRAWGRLPSFVVSVLLIRNTPTCVGKTLRDYSLFLLSRQNNIETSSFSDTSCSPDNSMSWRFGSPMP